MVSIPNGIVVEDPKLIRLTGNIIYTTNHESGTTNGFVMPVVNEHEAGTEPIEQVYITAASPGARKGPHLHTGRKQDRFLCLQGECVIVCRNEQTYEYFEFKLEGIDDNLVVIPPYVSHAILPLGRNLVYVLSMPSEGFVKGQPYNQEETVYTDYDWSKWWQ